jgi:hypothetical protein
MLYQPMLCIHIDENISLNLMITIQKFAGNVENVPQNSPDIY